MIGPNKNKLYPNENIKTVCYISNFPKANFRSRLRAVNEII